MPPPRPYHRDALEPSPWVRRFAPLIGRGGAVLDLACGAGRHARLFAARGHPVVAVDRDLSRLGALAGDDRIEAVAADLEDGSPWPLAGRRFAGIIVVNYLYRPLFEVLIASLETGGVLIYDSFARGNERLGRPANPDFLLAPGELLEVVRGRLQTVAYEHGMVSAPRSAVVERICAVNDAGPATEAPPHELFPGSS